MPPLYSIQTIPKETLMAILKHIAVKNADYGEAQRYLIFKHDEKTGNAILDETEIYSSGTIIFWMA